jgi:hypothetical protein
MSQNDRPTKKDMPMILITKPVSKKPEERRSKSRFPIERELRYKVLRDHRVVEVGTGKTLNLSSAGVAFRADHDLTAGALVELSISWPVLLDDKCPVRLVAFGRLLRSRSGICACTIDKYEFRTQSRVMQTLPARTDTIFQRWADSLLRERVRGSVVQASAS